MGYWFENGESRPENPSNDCTNKQPARVYLFISMFVKHDVNHTKGVSTFTGCRYPFLPILIVARRRVQALSKHLARVQPSLFLNLACSCPICPKLVQVPPLLVQPSDSMLKSALSCATNQAPLKCSLQVATNASVASHSSSSLDCSSHWAAMGMEPFYVVLHT